MAKKFENTLSSGQKTVMRRKIASLKTVKQDVEAIDVDIDAKDGRRLSSLLRRHGRQLDRIINDLERLT